MTLGLGLLGLGLSASGAAAAYALAGGAAGLALGLLYLASPAWRLTVIVDEEGLEVTRRGARRFRLPWHEVARVVASADTRTCFVDGGDPARSLLVPGPGAAAPYDIEDRDALYQAIVERVPAERIEWVALIETARAAPESRAAADAQATPGTGANATAAPGSGMQAGEPDAPADRDAPADPSAP